jgi:hypothetical protein
VLFVFMCFALTCYDTDILDAACGPSLRNWTMTDTIFNSIGAVCLGAIWCAACFQNTTFGHRVMAAVSILYFLFLLISGAFTLDESVKALNDAACKATMRNMKDSLLFSKVVHSGAPLMAYTGIAYGALSITAFTTACVIFVCCMSCNTRVYELI